MNENFDLLYCKAGEEVVVKHLLGDMAADVLEAVERNRYRFTVDAYCVGELCDNGRDFFHLRQAIEIRPGKELTDKVTKWPRLRRALHKAGIKPVNVPGGASPLHYNDTIAVPDHNMSGAYYFLVKRKDIGKYLALLPKKGGKQSA